MDSMDVEKGAGSSHQAPEASGRDDEGELYFLIAHALSAGPLAHVGEALASEAATRGLLPQRTDWTGAQHSLTLGGLQRRYAHLAPDALAAALRDLLAYRQAEAAAASRPAVSSLLDPAALPGPAALARLPSYAARPPLWSLPPFSLKHGGAGPPRPLLSLLRETGVARGGRRPPLSPRAFSDQLQHHYTVRGHAIVTYCVVYDRTGRYVITGSDDALAKVWAAGTGLLRATCRGHAGEVSDLSVNADSTMFASGSVDGVVRVWSLREGELGQPVAVLMGHTDMITAVDFHPTNPNVLISSSFDGTLRVWDAKDRAVVPLVVRWRGDEAAAAAAAEAAAAEAPRQANPMRIRLGSLNDWQPGAAQDGGAGGSGGGAGGGVRATRQSDRRLAARSAASQPQEGGRTRRASNAAAAASSEDEGAAAAPAAAPAPAAEAEAQADGQGDGDHKLLACSWTRDGRYIVAGSNDHTVYVWRWPSPEEAAAEAAAEAKASAAAGPRPAGVRLAARFPGTASGSGRGGGGGLGLPPPVTADGRAPVFPWPTLAECGRLEGHSNDIWLILHSNSGDMMASGAVDGTVRVWRRPAEGAAAAEGAGGSRRRAGATPFSGGWTLEATLEAPPDEEAAAVARRRGRPPPTPRVDQLAWTCDDSRLVVTMHDLRVHVFAMPGGALLHLLKGHAEPTHIVLTHPTDPALAVTSSYSGEACVWDVVAGAQLRSFDSAETRPGARRWADRLPIVDGYMAPDGASFVLTDAAGQMHVYGLGPRPDTAARAPYDQFLDTDYEQLVRDLDGNVGVAADGRPAHVASGREAMVDACGTAYPLPFQEAFFSGRLLQVPAGEAVWQEEGRQPGYMLHPPALTAAAWRIYASGGSETAAQNASARASARLIEQEAVLDAEEASVREAARRRRGGGGGGAPRARAAAPAPAAPAPAARGRGRAPSPPPVVYVTDISDGDHTSDEDFEFDEDDDGRWPGRGRRRRDRNGVRLSSRLADRQPQEEGAGPSAAAGSDGEGSLSPGERLARQRAQREERHARRQAAHAAAMAQQRRRGGQAGRARDTARGERRARRDAGAGGSAAAAAAFIIDDSDDEEDLVDLVDEDGDDYFMSEDSSGSFDAEEEEEEEEEVSGGGGRASRRRRRTDRSRRQGERQRASKRARRTSQRAEDHDDADEEAFEAEAAAAAARPRSGASGPRPASAYAWLSDTESHPALYVPQAGDEVVYLREGHAAALVGSADARPPPWEALPRGGGLRPAEPATVVALNYALAVDGSGATVVQATLQLSDPLSPAAGATFGVDVLPPSAGQPDFLVLKPRFLAAVGERWALGDACVAFWQTGGGGGGGDADGGAGGAAAAGEWWRGKVVTDRRAGGDAGVDADPFACGGLWERYEVEWEGPLDGEGQLVRPPAADTEDPAAAEDGGDGAGPSSPAAPAPAGDADRSAHSPWELFRWEAVREAPLPPGTPQLDPALADAVAAAVGVAASQPQWELFQAAPDWNERYRSIRGRLEYYNRRVPLPLGLMDISGRLLCRYYRQKEAVQHDVRTISDNAQVFNGVTSVVAGDAKALARYLLAAIDAGAGEGGEGAAAVDVAPFLAEAAAGWQDPGDSGEEEEGEEEAATEEADSEEERGGRRRRPAERRPRQREGARERRRPAWYEGSAAFEDEEDEEEEEGGGDGGGAALRRSSRRRGSGGSGAPSPARSGGGRYSLRVPLRMSYQEPAGEAGGGGGGRGDRSRPRSRQPSPLQQAYVTRRSQAAQIDAIDAAVAAAGGEEPAEAGEEAEGDGAAHPSRMTFRLRRS